MRDTHPAANPAALAAATRRSSNAWLVTMTVVALVGIAVGAALGSTMYHPQDEEPTATAQIRLGPPVDLMAMATGAPTDQSTATAADYVAGEVAYLSGKGFAQTLTTRLRRHELVDFTVTQNAMSPVLTLQASGATPAEATRTVQAAVDLYAAGLRARTDQQLKGVLEAFKRWTAEAPRDPARRNQVAALRANIELQATRPGGLDVLAAPSADQHTGGHWPFGAVFGGLLGGVVALAALIGYRARSGRLRSAFDVAESVGAGSVDAVLTPEVSLPQIRRTDERSRVTRARLGRTLFAQCERPSGGQGGRLIVVIGASAKSGSADVAALLHGAAAESGDATLVTLSDRPVTAPGHADRTVIVDAGTTGESAFTGDVIAAATEVILVARLNVDTVDTVAALASTARVTGTAVKALLTFQPWWTAMRSGSRTAPAAPVADLETEEPATASARTATAAESVVAH